MTIRPDADGGTWAQTAASRRHKSCSEYKNHKVGRTIIFNEYQQTRVIADNNRKKSTDSSRRPLSIIDIFRIIHVYTVLLVVSTNVPIDNREKFHSA